MQGIKVTRGSIWQNLAGISGPPFGLNRVIRLSALAGVLLPAPQPTGVKPSGLKSAAAVAVGMPRQVTTVDLAAEPITLRPQFPKLACE